MQQLDFERTRDIVKLALGYALEPVPNHRPKLSFDLAPELAGLGATSVAEADRLSVARQVHDACAWCAMRFPLKILEVDRSDVWAFSEILLGRSAQAGEYLTASSPHRAHSVFVAAPWPLSSVYRLGSLLAHEAMHQALYSRERISRVARFNSLAYSPWKQQLRAGRLVWHALWTFSAQFVLLAEAMLKDGAVMLCSDPGLLDFLAEMEVRIIYCAESLVEFEILEQDETRRVEKALIEVRDAAANLVADADDYASKRASWLERVANEIGVWSARELPRAEAL